MRNIFFLAGGAALLLLLSRLRFKQKAIFTLRAIRPGGRLFAPVFNIDMAIANPTNQEITVKSITGTLNVQNAGVATVQAFGDQKIQANSETIIKLQARPSAIGIFETIRELLEQPAGSTRISFTGTANVDGLVVPISESKMI